jgi:hypothetical protein
MGVSAAAVCRIEDAVKRVHCKPYMIKGYFRGAQLKMFILWSVGDLSGAQA